jgi:hypothetical protein
VKVKLQSLQRGLGGKTFFWTGAKRKEVLLGVMTEEVEEEEEEEEEEVEEEEGVW